MTATQRIRVLVVEDHALVRQGLMVLLSSCAALEVVGNATNGQEAVTLFKALQPNVTLMDLRLPVMSGVDAIREIRKSSPDARVVVLTTFDGDEDIFRAMQAGAKAYLLKGMNIEELLETIQAVHEGHARIPQAIAAKLAQRVSSDTLSTRELEVLRCIVAGRANKQIALDLFISEATVKTHVINILAKLGVADRTQAAVTALQRGIVYLP